MIEAGCIVFGLIVGFLLGREVACKAALIAINEISTHLKEETKDEG